MGKIVGWILALIAVLFVVAMFANGADFTMDSMAPLAG